MSFLLFVVPHQCSQGIPVVAVLVDIRHAAAQAGLQVLWVVAEQGHDGAPGHRGKDGPGVVADLGAKGLVGHDGEAGALLDGQAGEGQRDAGKDVDDNLLVDRRDLAVARAGAKDKVAADETGEEAVVGTWRRKRAAVS